VIRRWTLGQLSVGGRKEREGGGGRNREKGKQIV